ncbi:MAG: DUF3160 domain-containing protein, partial [Candidatus Odinarchaeota archaeon]|nr:DUF3160 domain-containing protein [Candidatus Odinarchaeota archaeon]
YTQYKPRGYYTINQILRNYFKAVMYMGRMYFEISNANPFTQLEENATRPIVQTLQALIISDMMNKVYVHMDNGTRMFFDIWSRIYNVTSYFVGLSDDLTPVDYKKVSLAVFGEIKNVTTFDNITKVAEVIETVKALPPPKISAIGNKNKTAETGMRLMGQRFILDSYIFQMLVHDSVYERYMPTGLDILNVFGYSRAEMLLSTESEEYKKQLEKLKTEIKQMNSTEWTKNLYNGWLYVLQALLKESYNGYPTFMQTDAWKDEKMNTFLGSWTELRHDTILYAKQSYSIGATAAPPPPSFTEEYRCVGYVEPIPLLWSRLTGLINLTLHGLQLLDVLPYIYWQKLTAMRSLTEFLLYVTLKELRGEPLSDAENLAIYDIGVNITRILQDLPERNRETGIVADVHTDPNPPSVSPTGNKVLEEGVGYIFYLIAIFVRADNKLEFAAGPVFSYYEFLQPMSDRLTDEQWREMLSSMPPPLPDWTTSFIP